MLPEGICAEAVTRVYINDNFFAGTVAESLPLSSNPKLSPPKKVIWKSRAFHYPRTLPAVLSRSSHAYSLSLHRNYFEGLCKTHECNIELYETRC
eukprot:1772665-Amphidinium_carterae.1